MFKRKQWASAVRRGRKHAKYDEDAASPVGSVMKDKEELEEEPSERREDETNKKMRIMKRPRKRKKGDCYSGDITSHRPSPLEEFSDSDIDLDCDNEKEEQHHVYPYNPSSALLTTTTPLSSMPRPLIVPSRCCHHDDKDISKYKYEEFSSSASISSSGSSASPSHSPIRSSSSFGGRRKKIGKHINNKNKRVGKNLTHRCTHRVIKEERKRRGRGRKGFSKRTKRRIYFMVAVGIKLLIVLLTLPL
nr:MAG: hypothetical protein [Hemigrapsus takanoi nimavirus]